MAFSSPTTSTAPVDRARPNQPTYGNDVERPQRHATETKAAFKTTEFIAYVVAVVGVLVASYLVKTTDGGHADYFRADKAWFYIVLLTVGYLGSRGLAKSGSREHFDS
jgi:hypothetical protein